MGRIISIKGKMYDTQTSNESFLQIAMDLKTIGVKEWYFMLEIKDPSLIKVNPHAKKEDGKTACTKDQIERITIECARNPWYYLREVVRIVASGDPNGIPYRANRGNIAQTWCLLHGIDSWLCLTRQQGKTKSALAILTWAYSFGTRQSTFIFINKDGDNAKMNLRDFADILDHLPEYLRYAYIIEEDGKTTKARKNATRIEHPVTHNEIIVKPKATSYDSALTLARGRTAPIIHYDEVEFTPFIDVIIENSVSTYETAARRSKEVGALYGRIFTSTPGDIDTDPGARAEKLLAKTARWSDEMYNWGVDEINNFIRANQKMGVVYIEYSYLQIGLTHEWFKEISGKIGNMITVRREILLQRLRGSSLSPYNRDDIDKIIDLAKLPIRIIMLQKYYRLDVYKELNRSLNYIVGVDCATGSNKDNNAISVIHPHTLEIVAEFESPYIGEPDFEELIKELVKKHIPRACLCIERNNVGSSIIAHLLQSEIGNRIYFDKDKEIVDEMMKDLENVESMLKAKAKAKTYYGVWTGPTSRKTMFGILANHIKNYKNLFVGQNVTRDISKLIQKGDRIEAAAGFHDDSVMSYLIGLYVYYFGNNIELFGIRKDGAFLEQERNMGLIREDIDDVDYNGLPIEVQETFEVEKRRQTQETYDDLLRRALEQSQQRSQYLTNRGLLEGNAYELSNKKQDDFNDDFDSDVDLSFFDEINNF